MSHTVPIPRSREIEGLGSLSYRYGRVIEGRKGHEYVSYHLALDPMLCKPDSELDWAEVITLGPNGFIKCEYADKCKDEDRDISDIETDSRLVNAIIVVCQVLGRELTIEYCCGHRDSEIYGPVPPDLTPESGDQDLQRLADTLQQALASIPSE